MARQLKKAKHIKIAFSGDETKIIRRPSDKPLGFDINIRLIKDDDLQSFCSKFDDS